MLPRDEAVRRVWAVGRASVVRACEMLTCRRVGLTAWDKLWLDSGACCEVAPKTKPRTVEIFLQSQTLVTHTLVNDCGNNRGAHTQPMCCCMCFNNSERLKHRFIRHESADPEAPRTFLDGIVTVRSLGEEALGLRGARPRKRQLPQADGGEETVTRPDFHASGSLEN